MTDPVRRGLARLRRKAFVPSSIDEQLRRQARQMEKLSAQVAQLREQWRPTSAAANYRAVEHGRLMNQVGVLEERLGQFEERLSAGTFVADGADQAEARSLLEEVRREHQQVRVRMQIISHYEERLRRVEDAIAQLYDGDVRHVL
jgi:septation ring formation regulator EzrA